MDTAKLFANGRSQAVRLPKEYRFEGTEVFIKKVGNTVVLIPATESWQSLVDSLAQFSGDFMENRDFMDNREQPEEQERESPFV